MNKYILAIDPANIESAYCVIDTQTYRPIYFDKVENDKMFYTIEDMPELDIMIIEEVRSYGMSVGQSVFDTCRWYGRFEQFAIDNKNSNVIYICRKDVKINLCGSMKAKDSNIRQALIDRFGVVGTKKNKGWFFGFHDDIWSAYAVGVTYLDKLKEGEI